jgi:pimeloyl-ACP methyl ester carboxylesterase
MSAAPSHVAADALRRLVAFDALAAAAACKVPALHLAALPWNQPHLMAEWLPGVVNAWTVSGHFSQLEAPDQVNAMIDAFMRHYVQSLATV